MANVKEYFKALPHVEVVWVDGNGGIHLGEIKGAKKITREEAMKMKDAPKSEVAANVSEEIVALEEKLKKANEDLDEARINLKLAQDALDASEKEIQTLTEENTKLKAEAATAAATTEEAKSKGKGK